MTCKSPTHKAYTEALETLDIAAGLAAKYLTEARAADPAMRPDRITVAFDEAERQFEYARRTMRQANANLDAHFDKGCANLAPRGLVKGETYNLTVSGVAITGKITSITPDTIRIKIAWKSGYDIQHYSMLAVSPDQITAVAPIR